MLGLGNILTKGGAILGFPNEYSFNFDGSNDHLETASPINVSGDSSRTFSAWIRPDSLPSNGNAVDVIAYGNQSSGQYFEFGIFNDSGTIKAWVNLWGEDVRQAQTFTTGTWYHYAVVFTNSASGQGTIKLYINGSLIHTSGTLGQTNAINTGNTAVGIGYRTNNDLYFDGHIDEVAVWNTALDASTIAKIASKPVDLTKYSASNLKLWLRAGDASEPESNTAIARSDFYTDFDGTDDYVSVADDSSLALTTALSVSAWVNFASVSGSKTIAGHFDYPNNQRSWSLAWLDDTTNYLRFFVSGDGSSFKYNRYAWTPTVGQWYHLTATYNAGTTKLYIDGSAVTVDAESSQPTSLHNSTGALFIGAVGNSSTNADKMEGKLSSVSLYQTPLDAQTIKQFAKSRFTPIRDNRFSVVDFDGTNDHIVVSDNDALDFGTGDFTASLWHKSGAEHDQPFFNKKASFADDTAGWTIYMENGNDQMRCRIAGGSSNVAVSAGTKSVSDNNWHFTTMVRSGDNLYLYTDGVLEGSTTGVNSLNVDNSDDLYIGRGGSSYPQISVSSASLYNVAKSADEVYAIYQKGITYDESSLSGLVGYWRMGDDISKAYPTIADSSSNSNDGTIENSLTNNVAQQMVAGYDLGAFESAGDELSSQLIPNNDFSTNDSTGYTSITNENPEPDESGWTFSGGTATFSGVSGGVGNFYTATDIFDDTSALYKVTIDVASISNCKVRLLRGGVNVMSTHTDTAGVYTTFSTITGTGVAKVSLTNGSGTTSCVLNSISVQKVLQSADLSDTYPATIDVTEPILGASEIPSASNRTYSGVSSNDWTSNGTTKSFSNDKMVFTFDGDIPAVVAQLSASPIGSGSGIPNGFLKVTFEIDSSTTGTYNFNNAGGTVTANIFQLNPIGVGTHTVYANVTNGNSGSYFRFYEVTGSTGDKLVLNSFDVEPVRGNVGTMTNMASSDLVYSSVLPDQSFLTGVNSAYNFIDLDGSDQSISGSISRGDAITEFTFSTWTNIDSFSDYERIFSGDDGTVRAGFRSTGKFTFHPNTTIGDTDSTGSAYSTGQWYHTMVTYNKATTTLKYYRDGDLAFTKDDCSSSDMDISGLFWIGSYRGIALFLDGSVGQTAIWDRDLSSDVGSIYNLGRHGNLLNSYSDNLLGYFAMGALDASTGLSDSISTIYDRSGNSNHGTPQNADAGDLKSPPNAQPNGYAKGDTNRSTTTP